MVIPDVSDKIWQNVLLQSHPYEFEFLALKILLTRLKTKLRFHPDDESLQNSAKELRELFVKTANIPKVQADLQKIVRQGGAV
jgi:hypothetical protein